MSSLQPSEAELLASLDTVKARINATKVDVVSEEWRTREGWQVWWGLNKSQAQQTIKDSLALGVMEERPFRIQTIKCVRPLPHYRLVVKV